MTIPSRMRLEATGQESGSKTAAKARLIAGLTAGFIFAVCWWFLSNGSAESWLIGAPALATAVWARLRLREDSELRLSLVGLAKFLPLFVWESFRGGVDVVRRTLTHPLRVNPGFVNYRTRLETPAARTFFTSCVGLLPGTLAADLKDDLLEIHSLDLSADLGTELRRLEAAVARLVSQPGRGL